MKKKYAEKFKDPRWQKKRLEILNRDNWQCQSCGDDSETLHVHHTTYLPNRDPWDYDDTFLITLCASCHSNEHDPNGAKWEVERAIKEYRREGFLYSDFEWAINTIFDEYPTRKLLSNFLYNLGSGKWRGDGETK